MEWERALQSHSMSPTGLAQGGNTLPPGRGGLWGRWHQGRGGGAGVEDAGPAPHCGGQPPPALPGLGAAPPPCGESPRPHRSPSRFPQSPGKGALGSSCLQGCGRGAIPTPSPLLRDTTCFDVIYGPPSIGSSLWRGRTRRVRQAQAGEATAPSARGSPGPTGLASTTEKAPTRRPLCRHSPLLQVQPRAEPVRAGPPLRAGRAERALGLGTVLAHRASCTK